MSTLINTNKAEITFNKKLINEKYAIFRVSSTAGRINVGSYLLDAPVMGNTVLSVYFTCGRSFYVLMERSNDAKQKLKAAIASQKEADDLTAEEMSIYSLDDYILLQLMINALGNYKSQSLRSSNLTGHYYTYNTDWIKHKKGETTIWRVPCIEIRVDKEMVLHADVRTFTSVKLRNKISFGKKGFNDYPQYVFSAKRTLSRKKKDDKSDDAFILRQLDGQKTVIPFLEIKNIHAFRASKAGITQSVISQFNTVYDGLARLSLHEVKEYARLCSRPAIAKKKDDAVLVHNILSRQSVNIVDTIKDAYSGVFCAKIRDILKDRYGVEANIKREISKNALNIRVIHNADYYDAGADKHLVSKDIAIQHITRENFTSPESAIAVVVHDLIIKSDLQCGKIRLYDWAGLEYQNDVVFGSVVCGDDEDHYYFMTIHPDGSFIIKVETDDFFGDSAYDKYMDVLASDDYDDEIVEIVSLTPNRIYVIKDAGLIALPDLDGIANELESGNTKLRSKVMREMLLSGCLDIRTYKEEERTFYFVGDIGAGMQTTVGRAANIRELCADDNGKVDIASLLPLMDVDFVRNGQLTVIPFPFKYLREYIRSHLV